MAASITVRDAAQRDAPAIAALFRRSYGAAYGTALFYDVPALGNWLCDGRLRSVVAVEGECVVAHTAITIRHPGAQVCETGNTVIDPQHRGQGLLKLIGMALHERVAREGFAGYVHYPTTAHAIMQRASVAYGGLETGIMLAYVPRGAGDDGEANAEGPLAVTVAFQPIGPLRSRAVHLPVRYEALLGELYDALALPPATLQTTASHAPERSEVSAEYNPRRESLHLVAVRAGSDLAEAVCRYEQQYQPRIALLDLPLNNPWIDGPIAALARDGFFYSALLPAFAETDVLRLQALRRPAPGDFAPSLANARAQALCLFIRDDAS